ncbi:family 20 glycosylhydrolase [Neisseria sp. 19428wB4_WF04]|nr:family 20 glycosylhydrolase [Neisseria sp. 19428wB4_WF04]TFU42890.1 hypothetical protein E4T99_08355 [Neisseria sp. WF04]
MLNKKHYSVMKQLFATLFLGVLMLPAAASNQGVLPQRVAQQPKAAKQNGLMLDTARRFYSAGEIRQFIDMLAAAGGQFLHLHFSDDENYALESPLLGQTTASARRDGNGVYTNPATGRPFLSFKQMRGLVRYAESKKIELVPEIGSPAHVGGILTLLKHKHGQDYVRQLQPETAAGEIDIANPESVRLVKALLDEAAEVFNRSRHFHIGGDEFGYSPESNHKFIGYANTLAAHLAGKGLKTRLWNDGLINSTLGQLNRSIEITYWSYDGDPADPEAARYRRSIRAGLPELAAKGFSVLNYNSYYLYLVPNGKRNFPHDAAFSAQDIQKRWHLGVWDGENTANAADTAKITGAALAVWGENSRGLSNETLRRHIAAPLRAMINKTKTAKP